METSTKERDKVKLLEICQNYANNKGGKCLSFEYVRGHSKLLWECEFGHTWCATPSNVKRGKWCPLCSRNKKLSIQDCINYALLKNGACLSTNYINASSLLMWRCEYGHVWQSNFNNIRTKGSWCPICSKCSTQTFIEAAQLIHKNKYDYSLVNYINNCSKVSIICSTHGIFKQQPNSHLNGSGCPSCSHNISKIEQRWLDSLNIPQEHRFKSLCVAGKLIKPDAYNPVTNTIYEFYGDFWHGNPCIYSRNDINKAVNKTFGELYDKTTERENMLKQAGFNVISIWEDDFK